MAPRVKRRGGLGLPLLLVWGAAAMACMDDAGKVDGSRDDASGAECDHPLVQRWYDADGDGHAGPVGRRFCPDEAPSPGWLCSRSDCDDTDPAAFPGAPEVCDGVDNDCNGGVDVAIFVRDLDGDGFPGTVGDAFESVCDVDEDWSSTVQDPDDTDPSVYPGAPELCADEVDNDGDGVSSCARTMHEGGSGDACQMETNAVLASATLDAEDDGTCSACGFNVWLEFPATPTETTDPECPRLWASDARVHIVSTGATAEVVQTVDFGWWDGELDQVVSDATVERSGPRAELTLQFTEAQTGHAGTFTQVFRLGLLDDGPPTDEVPCCEDDDADYGGAPYDCP